MKRLLLLVAGFGLLVGCQADGADGPAGVALDEWSLIFEGTVDSGPGELLLRNDGEFPHTVVIARDTGEVVVASEVVQAGSSGSIVVDLEPGTYQFTCRIVAETGDGRLVDHFEKGMVQTVVVGHTAAADR